MSRVLRHRPLLTIQEKRDQHYQETGNSFHNPFFRGVIKANLHTAGSCVNRTKVIS
jgi:hypothetical protein